MSVKRKITGTVLTGVAAGLVLLAFVFVGDTTIAQGQTSWTPTIASLASPAGVNSGEAQLTVSKRGVLLSWIERADSKTTLRFAERTRDGWTAPRTVASGKDWSVNGLDLPTVLRLSNGTLVAQWMQTSGGMHANNVRLSYSNDDGKKWAPAFNAHKDDASRERLFPSLFETPTGGAGVVWLSGGAARPMSNAPTAGPNHAPGAAHTPPQGGGAAGHQGHQGQEGHGGRGAMSGMGGEMTLRFAAFDGAWKSVAELTVDPRVCECCSTAAVATSDGVVAAYRNRSDDEVRDIYVSRFADGRWSEPTAVHGDNWRIPSCPINGPALSARGRDVAIAWYTVKEDQGHSYAAFSRDAGRTFSAPIRLDDAASVGRVDVELLPDGSALASWIEVADGRSQFRVRRVGADGTRSAPVTVASLAGYRTSPRLAVAANEIVFVWTETNGSASAVKTASARLPGSATQ